MQVFLSNPTEQSLFFGILLGAVFLVTLVTKKHYTSLSLTQELKGFAILTIIFAHIGYYLTTSAEFLFPLSILAGVGVNIFLFLSGYGITMSQMKKDESVFSFYSRRLLKLFIPFWIVLSVLYLASFVFFGETYAPLYILKSFLGIFTSADIHTDINSPFWYFTLILFYYLLFPLLFFKKRPWVTALALYIISWVVLYNNPAFFADVIRLYTIHTIAFPLGITIAWLGTTHSTLLQSIKEKYEALAPYAHPLTICILLGSVGYLAIHSNVGALPDKEQWTSILTMCVVLLLFVLKKRESKLLSLFGLFSYEIYLFHWPLLYRYDVLYTHLPAWIATALSLVIFIPLAMVVRALAAKVSTLFETR